MPMGQPEGGSRPEVPGTAAFGKFMAVLQAVADASGKVTTGQLGRALAMPRPTVHRIVAALLAEGMLAEDAAGGIGLGPRLVSLAFRAWDGSALRQLAQESLSRLRDRLDETVHLAVRDGAGMVYIDKLESRRNVRMASRIGTRVPLHSSSVGKAWLASLPEVELREVLADLDLTPRTSHSIRDAAALLAEIERTRARGYSVDLQENELDICCYGKALHGPAGRVLGCISVSMPRYRFLELPEEEVVGAMQACADSFAAQAGRSA